MNKTIKICDPSNTFACVHHVTEYSPAKTGEYPRIFPNFRNCACCEKYLKDNKHDSLHLTSQICLHIFPWTLSAVYLKLCSRKIVCFLEQIMSVDKYPSIFWCQMEAIVYICYDKFRTKQSNYTQCTY